MLFKGFLTFKKLVRSLGVGQTEPVYESAKTIDASHNAVKTSPMLM